MYMATYEEIVSAFIRWEENGRVDGFITDEEKARYSIRGYAEMLADHFVNCLQKIKVSNSAMS